MAINLKKVLSAKTYENLEEYFENGKDAISMLGYHNTDTFTAGDVVTKFQTLADPDFISEVRENWGDANSTMPFQVMEAVEDVPYIAKKYNSFSLKGRFFQIGKLRFPLVGNYKNIEKNYFIEEDKIKNYDAIKNLFEEKFNIKIVEKNKTRRMIEYKGGKIRYCGEAVSSVLKTFKRFKNGILSLKSNVINKDYSLRLSPSKLGFGRAKLIVASQFKGQDIQKSDKVVALINYWSAKAVFQISQKFRNVIKKSISKNAKQVFFVAQLLTDIFISQAFDMGNATNKKIDNALKLQLSNALAYGKLSPNEMKMAAKIAERATYSILEKLDIPFSEIKKNRERMGISYINEFDNIYDVLFGETTKSDFVKLKDDIFYTGGSKIFDNLVKQNEQTQNFTPFSQPEPEFIQPELNQPEYKAEAEMASTMPSKQTKPDVAEEQRAGIVDNNAVIDDDDFFEHQMENGAEEENIITPESQTEKVADIAPVTETPELTKVEEKAEVTPIVEPIKQPEQKSTKSIPIPSNQVVRPNPKKSFFDMPEDIYYDMSSEIEDYDFSKDIIEKPVEVKTQNNTITNPNPTMPTSPKPIENPRFVEEYEKINYNRKIDKYQKTLADFEAKSTSKEIVRAKDREETNVISPVSEKAEPNIIYIQPLNLGKISEPLPKKAIIKSSEITYKQAEVAIDEIINNIVGNILKEKENRTKTNAVKFEEKIENQISKLTVKQMQEMLIEVEKFKVETLTTIFKGELAVTKEECGVKSASALINKEPKERHTLLKSDIKKIVIAYLKKTQIETKVVTKQTETETAKISNKKKLSTSQIKDKDLTKAVLPPKKKKPVKVKRLKCATCPLCPYNKTKKARYVSKSL